MCSYLQLAWYLFQPCSPLLVFTVDSYTVAHLNDVLPHYFINASREELDQLATKEGDLLAAFVLNVGHDDLVCRTYFGDFPHWNYHCLRWNLAWFDQMFEGVILPAMWHDVSTSESQNKLRPEAVADPVVFLKTKRQAFWNVCQKHRMKWKARRMYWVGPAGCFELDVTN